MTFCHFSVMSVDCGAALSPLGAATPVLAFISGGDFSMYTCVFLVVAIGNAFFIPVAMSALTPPFKDQHALA